MIVLPTSTFVVCLVTLCTCWTEKTSSKPSHSSTRTAVRFTTAIPATTGRSAAIVDAAFSIFLTNLFQALCTMPQARHAITGSSNTCSRLASPWTSWTTTSTLPYSWQCSPTTKSRSPSWSSTAPTSTVATTRASCPLIWSPTWTSGWSLLILTKRPRPDSKVRPALLSLA